MRWELPWPKLAASGTGDEEKPDGWQRHVEALRQALEHGSTLEEAAAFLRGQAYMAPFNVLVSSGPERAAVSPTSRPNSVAPMKMPSSALPFARST